MLRSAYSGVSLLGIAFLDEGVFEEPPEGVFLKGQVSPDFRYVARACGKPDAVEIVEYRTGRVLPEFTVCAEIGDGGVTVARFGYGELSDFDFGDYFGNTPPSPTARV